MFDELLGPQKSRRMKVEIHSHTDVHSPCSNIPPRELVAMADASGYDALFLTDHHRVWSEKELASLNEMSERVKIYPGIEITLPDRVDVLVLGATDPIYESLRTPDAVFAQATADGYMTIIAHPYRWMSELPAYCALADAVETYTCNHPDEAWVQAARQYADTRRISEVYSSDAHGLNFMNKFWIETHEAFETIEEFRRLIISEKYDNCRREFAMSLPPSYKAANMAELSDEDLAALTISPATQA